MSLCYTLLPCAAVYLLHTFAPDRTTSDFTAGIWVAFFDVGWDQSESSHPAVPSLSSPETYRSFQSQLLSKRAQEWIYGYILDGDNVWNNGSLFSLSPSNSLILHFFVDRPWLRVNTTASWSKIEKQGNGNLVVTCGHRNLCILKRALWRGWHLGISCSDNWKWVYHINIYMRGKLYLNTWHGDTSLGSVHR